jgi:hypothetical protein
MHSYSIFVRNTAPSGGRRPELLAYDIHDEQEAQSIVSGIANAYPEHGFNPATRVYWFRSGGSVHEIYAWPHA